MRDKARQVWRVPSEAQEVADEGLAQGEDTNELVADPEWKWVRGVMQPIPGMEPTASGGTSLDLVLNHFTCNKNGVRSNWWGRRPPGDQRQRWVGPGWGGVPSQTWVIELQIEGGTVDQSQVPTRHALCR